MPVREDDPGIGHLAPWCEGYNDDTCHSHCKSEGFKNSNCTAQYVTSYKFDLILTCKPQVLYLRVSYPSSFIKFRLTFQPLKTAINSWWRRMEWGDPRVLASFEMLVTIQIQAALFQT